MTPPTSQKEVQNFIGLVYYYRDRTRLSHMFAPFNKWTYSKVKFKWTEVKQKSLEAIKRIVECNILSAYTDFNK